MSSIMIHGDVPREDSTQPVFPEGLDPIVFNGVLNDLSQLLPAPIPGKPIPFGALAAFAQGYLSSSSSQPMDYAKLRRDVLNASVNPSLMSDALDCFKRMLGRLLAANSGEMGRTIVSSYLSRCMLIVFPKYLREPSEFPSGPGVLDAAVTTIHTALAEVGTPLGHGRFDDFHLAAGD